MSMYLRHGPELCFVRFDSGERIGLAVIAGVSFVSLFALLVLIGLVVKNLTQYLRESPGGEWRLVNTHIEAYLLSLMFAELLVSLGGIMNVKWVHDGKAECGGYCDAQGALQQVGPAAVAMSTLAIAIHTFFIIFFRWTPSLMNLTWIFVISFTWLFACLFPLIAALVHSSGGHPYFEPSPYWCWISSDYVAEGLAGDYALVWLTALFSLIIYPLLFFRLRGNIVVNPDRWSGIHLRLQRHVSRSRSQRFSNIEDAENHPEYATKEAMKMLWYPLCYVITILPLSGVRWESFEGSHRPNFAASAAAESIFKLSGILNVVLFMLTRPNLLLFRQRRNFRPPLPSAGIPISISFSQSHSAQSQSREQGQERPEEENDIPLSLISRTGNETAEQTLRDGEREELSVSEVTRVDEESRGGGGRGRSSWRWSGSTVPRIPIRFPSPTLSALFTSDSRQRDRARTPNQDERARSSSEYDQVQRPTPVQWSPSKPSILEDREPGVDRESMKRLALDNDEDEDERRDSKTVLGPEDNDESNVRRVRSDDDDASTFILPLHTPPPLLQSTTSHQNVLGDPETYPLQPTSEDEEGPADRVLRPHRSFIEMN